LIFDKLVVDSLLRNGLLVKAGKPVQLTQGC
jgi:hypothetical protein